MKINTLSNKHSLVIKERNYCVICNSKISSLIDLPNLPLTDSFCWEPVENSLPGIDQELLYCEVCGHGQLKSIIAPDVLYGSNYFFRTSESKTARKGTEFFLKVIEEAAPNRKFNCVLDLGCNDLFLLNLLKEKADFRVGIDPVWKNREEQRIDKSIQVIGTNFEEVDFSSLPTKPDLIVCRHTLEHIEDPLRVLQTLFKIAAEDAIFVFEVPGFDGLLSKIRFDQIFHQHLQYFSLSSFNQLLNKVGGKKLLHRFNYHDWSAMAVAFVKGNNSDNIEKIVFESHKIVNKYSLFKKQMQSATEIIESYSDNLIYGYGAAQMLPILGYHLKTDFSNLKFILDDDKTKDGLGYWNLPINVICASKITDITNATILITALDNVEPIMKKLLNNRPRNIVIPLNVI